jgi:hypothetical protein
MDGATIVVRRHATEMISVLAKLTVLKHRQDIFVLDTTSVLIEGHPVEPQSLTWNGKILPQTALTTTHSERRSPQSSSTKNFSTTLYWQTRPFFLGR